MAVLNSYAVDGGVRFTGTFTGTTDGVPYDPPGGVMARVKLPDGTARTYTMGVDAEFEHPSVGVYELTILITASGVWACHMWGLGIAPNPAEGAAAADDRIAVRPTVA